MSIANISYLFQNSGDSDGNYMHGMIAGVNTTLKATNKQSITDSRASVFNFCFTRKQRIYQKCDALANFPIFSNHHK
jgi:hypothetical protein